MSVITPEVCDTLHEIFCGLAVNGAVPYRLIPQLFRQIGFQLGRR